MGGTLTWRDTGLPAVLGFARQRGQDRLEVLVNLGPQAQQAQRADGTAVHLAGWGWHIQGAQR